VLFRSVWTFEALLLLRALQAVPVLGPAVALSAMVLGCGAVARAAQVLRARGGPHSAGCPTTAGV
jgi:hypothetical protein